MKRTAIHGSIDASGRTPRSALTRIELLAILAAVALVLVIALPAVAGSVRGSEKHHCANNLRQIGLATQIYAVENHEHLPHPTWGSLSGNPGPDGWCYATRLDGVSIPSVANRWDVAPQIPYFRASQLGPLLDSQETLMCPTDARTAADQTDTLYFPRQVKLTSYTMNGSVHSFGSSRMDGNFGGTHPLTRLEPSALLYWEAKEDVPFYFNDAGNTPHEGISARHAGGGAGSAPVTMADGSVRYMGLQEFYDLAGGPVGATFTPARLPNDLWCDPTSPKGGFF